MSSLQQTRLSRMQTRFGRSLEEGFAGPWWRRSLLIISLLGGFLVGSNLTEHLANAVGSRTISALTTLIACELLVLLRRRVVTSPMAFRWRLLDHLRIGFVYAVVLEAFKVGS